MRSEESWRLLAETRTEPRQNLACDEALARHAGLVPTIRLWRNDPCVVLGRFQVAAAEINDCVCRKLGVPIYRRLTGGGAVYHDLGNLNVTVVIPRRDPLFSVSTKRERLPDLYAIVLEPLAAAVRGLGIKAQATAHEILVNGRKVSGVAAWLGVQKMLVHATLLIDSELDVLMEVLNGPGAPGNLRWARTQSRRVRVTSLVREGRASADKEKIEAAIIAAFASAVSQDLQPGDLTENERALEQDLFVRRYAHSVWHATGELPEAEINRYPP